MGAGPLKRWISGLFGRAFLLAYRPAYLRCSSVSWDEVKRWGPVVAAIRLGEGIPEEWRRLLRMVRRGFEGPRSGRAPRSRDAGAGIR